MEVLLFSKHYPVISFVIVNLICLRIGILIRRDSDNWQPKVYTFEKWLTIWSRQLSVGPLRGKKLIELPQPERAEFWTEAEKIKPGDRQLGGYLAATVACLAITAAHWGCAHLYPLLYALPLLTIWILMVPAAWKVTRVWFDYFEFLR